MKFDSVANLLLSKDYKAKIEGSEKEGDIAGPNASSWAPFLILRHFAVHLGQEYFSRDIYFYSTRIQNKFLSPIYLLNSNTGVRIRSIFGMLVIWLAF